jgi:hypothetical protein
MKNEAFKILLNAGVVMKEDLFRALSCAGVLELRGPWEGSNYSGDDITESNQRSLLRDYPDLLIDQSGPWGAREYGLALDPRAFGRGAVRDQARDLAGILADLKWNYPLYDESDNCALLDERAEEMWGAFLCMDLANDLEDLLGVDIDLDGMEEAFRELLDDHNIRPMAEGHRDVILPGIGDESFRIDLAKAAIKDGRLDLDYADELTDIGYTLMGEWMNEGYLWVHPNPLTLDSPEGAT